jgi:predicted ribosomally synthesized peptide with nif11-like leader
MKESVEKLLTKMNEDKAFAEKLLTQTEKEKVIELAGAEGIVITLEDIDEANEIIKKALELRQTEGELSEEELENVAGGSVLMLALSMLGLGSLITAATLSGTISALVTMNVDIPD